MCVLHAFATGQERCNKPESSAAKALLLTSSGARAPERKSQSKSAKGQEQKQERARERKKARERTRTRKQEREKEWQNPVPFKENYPPPRTYYSLIGCSPSAELSSRGRQSTWGGKLPLAHAQIICLPLRTQLSAPSCNGKCEGGSSHSQESQEVDVFF